MIILKIYQNITQLNQILKNKTFIIVLKLKIKNDLF